MGIKQEVRKIHDTLTEIPKRLKESEFILIKDLLLEVRGFVNNIQKKTEQIERNTR